MGVNSCCGTRAQVRNFFNVCIGRCWNLSPFSLGEYPALVIANVLTLQDALTLVATRARLMFQKCALCRTGMLAVNAGPVTVEDALGSSEAFAELSIACFNGPTDCVVSGSLEQLQAFKAHLDRELQCKSTFLKVPFGFHSAAMYPLLQEFSYAALNVTVNAPSMPIISSVIGDVVMPGDTSVFDTSYFSRHCLEPVLFEMGMNVFRRNSELAKIDVWIEIGPNATLLSLIKSNRITSCETLLLASLRKQQDPWLTLTSSLSQLYLSNVTVRWRDVFAHLPSLSCLSLPSYPFLRTKFWAPFVERFEAIPTIDPASLHLITDYSMLHSWTQYPSMSNGHVAIFETPISELADAIQGHRVGGLPLCPVSVYLEQIYAAVHLVKRNSELLNDGYHVVMNSIEFVNPLVYDAHIARTIKTSITLNTASGFFTVSSHVHLPAEEVIHMHGTFRFQLTLGTNNEFMETLPALTREILSIVEPHDKEQIEIFSSRTAYEVIFPRVVEYSEAYRTMQSIKVNAERMKGYATVKRPADHDRGSYVVHPIFLDTLLHVAGFVANHQGGMNDIFICTGVASVKVISEIVDNNANYGVYCSNSWSQDEGSMVAEAYAVELAEPRRIVAHIEGMCFRRVRLDSLKRGLAFSVGRPYHPNPAQSTPPPSRSLTLKPGDTCLTQQDAQDLVNDIEAEVFKLVLETSGLHLTVFDRDTDLASLGIDSLLSIELMHRLQDVFPDANLSFYHLHCLTLGELTSEIYSRCSIALSKSEQSCSRTSSPRTLVDDETTLEHRINPGPDAKRLLASVLYISVKELGDDVELESFGLDSLTAMEALHVLQTEFGVELPRNLFTRYRTLRAVRSFLSGHCKSESISPTSSPRQLVAEEPDLDLIMSPLRLPVPIQQCKDGDCTPLFLIHDGSGLINYYDRLPPLNRNIWAIYNPQLITGKPWESLSSMAIAYAKYVVETSSRPVILGGKCLKFGHVPPV